MRNIFKRSRSRSHNGQGLVTFVLKVGKIYINKARAFVCGFVCLTANNSRTMHPTAKPKTSLESVCP